MKIRGLFGAGSPTFSFEFFPPKTDEDSQTLYETIEELAQLAPSFVSVTYGAGGSTRARTVDLVKTVKNRTRIEAMAHLTCVGATREEIAAVLDDLRAGGVENVLALRGDPPKGEMNFKPVPGGFRYANELAAFVRENYDFCLGGACYPETHPEASSPEADLVNLKRKVDAGVEFLITQLFLVNTSFLRFRERAERAGIRVPIVAGIMPILSGPGIKRMASMCGAQIPPELAGRIEDAGEDAAEIRKIGVDYAWRQCRELLAEGVAGIHFYTLNRSRATKEIWSRLSEDSPGGRPSA